MFTGIIEAVGNVVSVESSGSNLDVGIESGISNELKIDQSVSHNGVCLTVVKVDGDIHYANIIDETLKRSNLGVLRSGDLINLERSLRLSDRLDGHLVQGHVDTVAEVTSVEPMEGSSIISFELKESNKQVLVDKGSISINGVSLTVVNPSNERFSVALIPYTMEHTNLGILQKGDLVNIEFDMMGKYVQKLYEAAIE